MSFVSCDLCQPTPKFCPYPSIEKKLSLLIFCGNTSFKFVNCDLCQHTSFLSLSFHGKNCLLWFCANTSWTLLILICVNTHLIFPLFSAWLSLNVSASDALIYPFVFDRLCFSIYAYAGHCWIVVLSLWTWSSPFFRIYA